MVSNEKILITGATGFIGANLTRALLEKGAKVYIFTRKTSDKWRIKDILKDITEYCVDLTYEQEVENIISHIKPEIIFHTAVYGGYPSQTDCKKIYETNLIGTINLINACRKSGFKLFINAGSSSEYGIKKWPMKESDTLEPVSDYGISKALATLFCQMKVKSEHLPITTFRFFSPYGYYEKATRLIPSVILSCLKGKSPEVLSPCAVRDFIFIEDVIDICLKSMENKDKVAGEIFNIGYGVQYSVEEVVNEIIQLTGNVVKPVYKSVFNSRIEPQIWQADISKVRDVLGWVPRYDLKTGLSKSIRWFAENMILYEQNDGRMKYETV